VERVDPNRLERVYVNAFHRILAGWILKALPANQRLTARCPTMREIIFEVRDTR
jgi:hypothetical protein